MTRPEMEFTGMVDRDHDDDCHDQGVADQVDPTEGVDCGIEDHEERDRGEAPHQWRGKQAEAHGELRDTRHRDEHVARNAEGQERFLLDEWIEPFRVGEFLQARPH